MTSSIQVESGSKPKSACMTQERLLAPHDKQLEEQAGIYLLSKTFFFSLFPIVLAQPLAEVAKQTSRSLGEVRKGV
jgi:hypothetical protein